MRIKNDTALAALVIMEEVHELEVGNVREQYDAYREQHGIMETRQAVIGFAARMEAAYDKLADDEREVLNDYIGCWDFEQVPRYLSALAQVSSCDCWLDFSGPLMHDVWRSLVIEAECEEREQKNKNNPVWSVYTMTEDHREELIEGELTQAQAEALLAKCLNEDDNAFIRLEDEA